MRQRFRLDFQSFLNKTPAYLFEKYIGRLVGFGLGYLSYKMESIFLFITTKDFFDKLITITTTLFGFLLTILTLIIQGSGVTIANMKKHGSYNRLVRYNRNIVILSGLVCLISLFLSLISTQMLETNKNLLKSICSLNFALFNWTLVDSAIFIRIFYKIQFSE